MPPTTHDRQPHQSLHTASRPSKPSPQHASPDFSNFGLITRPGPRRKRKRKKGSMHPTLTTPNPTHTHTYIYIYAYTHIRTHTRPAIPAGSLLDCQHTHAQSKCTHFYVDTFIQPSPHILSPGPHAYCLSHFHTQARVYAHTYIHIYR
ncbi:unnamed protein product, partial [Trypanosoma congolense IL3000]